MNSAGICHQISGCEIYVDAFHGHFLRNHTKNSEATFLLSHYHGDHYQNLPRDNKYKGPALIHCSHVTARLLIEVHKVQQRFVVRHDYGETFTHRIIQRNKKRPKKQCGERNDDDDFDDKLGGVVDNVKITFYDANHCPGACIILIELPDGKTTHLHTGDMRYHPRFQSYPLLQKAVQQRTLDLVYLDTTYCHEKHDFVPQEEAIESIASQTQELLSENCSKHNNSKNTLVLLSCYSIGKEKVLYEASKRSKQLVYVSEKKWKMLECIQQDESQSQPHEFQKEEDISSSSQPLSHHQQQQQQQQQQHLDQHTNILDRCTRDSTLSDLHVIPMGLAGEMFPFFRPNFLKIAKYVEELSSLVETKNNEDINRTDSAGDIPSLKEKQRQYREYDKVVAFIPTGWANASNWNKKNAISTKTVQLSSLMSLQVEVRLVSYSEHSSFPELLSFVEYLKPRKIIPTVYSDQNHYQQIERRFRSMIDSTRAKQAFFRSMIKNAPNDNLLSDDKNHSTTRNDKSNMNAYDDGDDESNEEIEIVDVIEAKNPPLANNVKGANHKKIINDHKINTIVTMGFDKQRAVFFLEKYHGNIQACIDILLSEGEQKSEDNYHKQAIGTLSSRSTTTVKKRKVEKSSTGMITDFFVNKKK
jgi:Cft2 family RNA processing exonuclease